MIPNALSIAGIDPSGGAGVHADLKAFAAHAAYGCGVVTALTAQNTRAVTGVQQVDAAFVRLQLDTLFDDVRIDAAKIGMLGAAAIIRTVADALAPRLRAGQLPWLVVDPVMRAKSGDTLLNTTAIGGLVEAILPLATLITPNLPEAGLLLRRRAPESVIDMRQAAERLRRLLPDHGHRWVLVKGGHLPAGEPSVDLLHDGDRMIELTAPRLSTPNTHGTGCSLSAAVTALLPQRASVPEAVREAKVWLTEAIRQSGMPAVGQGHGPVHHFHRLWSAALR
jgi:hydroxymethylpyrimidine/phosphomethylpyrimidine kinase